MATTSNSVEPNVFFGKEITAVIKKVSAVDFTALLRVRRSK